MPEGHRFGGLSKTVAVLSAAFAILVAPAAQAFCREITAMTPADKNDPVATGCYMGEPGETSFVLWWRNSCIGYSLQQDASAQVDLAEATQAADSAFSAWSMVSCGAGGPPAIAGVDKGPVACAQAEYNKTKANQNVIVFRDSWPARDMANTLGFTTLSFDTTTGEIYDADMEINSTMPITVDPDPPAGDYELSAIFTHEAGHFFGLAHSDDASAIMYAYYQGPAQPGSPASSGAAQHTVLSEDDIDGICSIYPPSGARSTSSGPVAAGSCDPTPRHGFSTLCGADQPDPPPPTETTKSGCAVAAGSASGAAGGLLVILFALAVAVLRRMGRGMGWGWNSAVRAVRGGRPRIARAAAAASFVAAVGMFMSRDLPASVSIAISFEELVHDSAAACVATPVEQLAVWEEGRIVTYTRARIDEVLAGDAPNEVWIRTRGGSVGSIGQIVEGEPAFTVGESSVLFLQPPGPHEDSTMAGIFYVTARAQGQFPIVEGADGRKRLSRARTGALVFPSRPRLDRLARRLGRNAEDPDAIHMARDFLSNRLLDEAKSEIGSAWRSLRTF